MYCWYVSIIASVVACSWTGSAESRGPETSVGLPSAMAIVGENIKCNWCHRNTETFPVPHQILSNRVSNQRAPLLLRTPSDVQNPVLLIAPACTANNVDKGHDGSDVQVENCLSHNGIVHRLALADPSIPTQCAVARKVSLQPVIEFLATCKLSRIARPHRPSTSWHPLVDSMLWVNW